MEFVAAREARLRGSALTAASCAAVNALADARASLAAECPSRRRRWRYERDLMAVISASAPRPLQR